MYITVVNDTHCTSTYKWHYTSTGTETHDTSSVWPGHLHTAFVRDQPALLPEPLSSPAQCRGALLNLRVVVFRLSSLFFFSSFPWFSGLSLGTVPGSSRPSTYTKFTDESLLGSGKMCPICESRIWCWSWDSSFTDMISWENDPTSSNSEHTLLTHTYTESSTGRSVCVCVCA